MMRMIEMTRADRRHREGGFTLIELLVVIVILGVLAAVVVFAVRGTGDKGRASAITIDERTIRTAQEAYCAKNGRYGSSQELIDGRFLSDEPEYHGVQAYDSGSGKCNGWTYVIARSAQAFGGPGPGDFEPVGGTPAVGFAEKLVQLSNGKVLALGYNEDFSGFGAALYDPSDSSWVAVEPPPFDLYNEYPAMELTGTTCGAHCGKVLVHLGLTSPEAWWFFDPAATSPEPQWQRVPNQVSSFSGSHTTAPVAVLLEDNPATAGSECDPNCGKVFITSYEPTATDVRWELYDPASDTFAQISYAPGQEQDVAQARLASSLSDGRVLLLGQVGGGAAPVRKLAFLFDPKNTFSNAVGATPYVFPEATAPAYEWRENQDPPQSAALPNGDILFTGVGDYIEPDDPNGTPVPVHVTEIYRPDPAGGQWRTTGGSCTPAPVVEPQTCFIFAVLPNGKVLAHTVNATYRAPEFATGQSFLFDPGTETWNRSGDFTPPDAAGAAVLLDPLVGPCDPQCNKVLLVGYNSDIDWNPITALLYSPPS